VAAGQLIAPGRRTGALTDEQVLRRRGLRPPGGGARGGHNCQLDRHQHDKGRERPGAAEQNHSSRAPTAAVLDPARRRSRQYFFIARAWVEALARMGAIGLRVLPLLPLLPLQVLRAPAPLRVSIGAYRRSASTLAAWNPLRAAGLLRARLAWPLAANAN
jgi:hypothetical protein